MTTETKPTATINRAIAVIPWDYFALAYAISWACWGTAYVVTRGRPPVTGGTEDLLIAAPPAMLALVLLGVFGPFASAFFLTWRRHGKGGVAALWKSGWRKIPLSWLLVILLLPPAMRLVSLLAAGAGVSFETFTNPLYLLGLMPFMYFLGGPFGEEFGWRGYALPRLLPRWSAFTASAILGAFWVLWHLPLFFIPGAPQAQIPFWPWTASVMAMAITMTWIHVHVGGVVFAAILFHTMANLSSDLFGPVREVAEGWASPEGLNTIIQVALAVAIVVIWGPKRLRRSPT